jgi:hypothetical protein
LDPFAIALWTLVLCGVLLMVYVTLAVGRFLRGVEDVRSQFELLTAEVAEVARVAKYLVRQAQPEEDVAAVPATPVAPEPASPEPAPTVTEPASPPPPVEPPSFLTSQPPERGAEAPQ